MHIILQNVRGRPAGFLCEITKELEGLNLIMWEEGYYNVFNENNWF